MLAGTKHAKVIGISSDAVAAKTGKGWDDWFKVLDKKGARKLKHTAIAALLHDELGCPPWWSQMIANGYEQAHGMREKHEMPDGFKISCTKTLSASMKTLFDAWNNKAKRECWLAAEDIAISKVTANRSLRIIWSDGLTRVHVMLFVHGYGKFRVSVEHSKLRTAKNAERMKRFWREKLDRLADYIDSK